MLHLYKTLGKMACGVKSKVMGGPLEKKDYIHDPRFVECRNCLRTKFFKKKLSAWGFSIHNDTIVPPMRYVVIFLLAVLSCDRLS